MAKIDLFNKIFCYIFLLEITSSYNLIFHKKLNFTENFIKKFNFSHQKQNINKTKYLISLPPRWVHFFSYIC